MRMLGAAAHLRLNPGVNNTSTSRGSLQDAPQPLQHKPKSRKSQTSMIKETRSTARQAFGTGGKPVRSMLLRGVAARYYRAEHTHAHKHTPVVAEPGHERGSGGGKRRSSPQECKHHNLPQHPFREPVRKKIRVRHSPRFGVWRPPPSRILDPLKNIPWGRHVR